MAAGRLSQNIKVKHVSPIDTTVEVINPVSQLMETHILTTIGADAATAVFHGSTTTVGRMNRLAVLKNLLHTATMVNQYYHQKKNKITMVDVVKAKQIENMLKKSSTQPFASTAIVL